MLRTARDSLRFFVIVLAAAGMVSCGGSGGGDGGDDDAVSSNSPPLAVGELDPAFGDVDPAGAGPDERLGYVLPELGGGNSSVGVAVATDADRRIIVIGRFGCNGIIRRMAIWVFLADGTADPGFNGSGGACVVHAALATSGGGNGYVTFAVNGPSLIYGVAIDAADRIVVVGEVTGPGATGSAVWRFLPDGTLDASFGLPAAGGGRTGFVLVDDTDAMAIGLDSFEPWNGVALDGQGRILVTGSAFAGGMRHLVAARLTAAGDFDTAFGDPDAGSGLRTGFFVLPVINAVPSDIGNGVAADDADRPIVVGRVRGLDDAANAVNFDGIVLRLTVDGELDTGFGEPDIAPGTRKGYRVLEHPPAGVFDDSIDALAIDGAGRILVHGTASVSTGTSKILWRLTPAGDVDTGFDNPRQPLFSPGLIQTQVTGSVGGAPACFNQSSTSNAIAVTAQDWPVVTGCSGILDKEIAVERFTATGDDDTSFGKGDRDATPGGFPGHFRFTRVVTTDAQDGGLGITIDREGRILVAGRTPLGAAGTEERMILLRLR